MSDLFRPGTWVPSPSTAAIAADLDVGEDEVREAIRYRHAYATQPQDALDGPQEPAHGGWDRPGGPDAALDTVIYRQALRPELRRWPTRERRLLRMRLVGDMTQTEIAARMGHRTDARVPAAEPDLVGAAGSPVDGLTGR